MKTIIKRIKKARVRHTTRTIVYGSIIFLVLAITGGLWYWNSHKKAIVRDKIETAIREKSNGLYKIKMDSLDVDEVGGFLSITNMDLTYDSARYLVLERSGKAPSILLNIQIPEISASGVKTPRALINNEIVGRKLEIKNPVIKIIYTGAGKDSSRNVPTKEIYEQILGNLDLIQADTVLITNAQISTHSLKTGKTGVSIMGVFITLVDVKIDSSSNVDSTRMMFAKKINFTSRELTWSSFSKLYNYSVDSLAVGSDARDLFVKGFRMTPVMNEDAFVRSLPAQDDRFDFSIGNIQLQNINIQQLLDENIVAENMMVNGISIKIYRDLNIPRDNKNRVGAYPHQLVQKIPMNVNVRKIVVSGGFLEYKEKNNITHKAAKIQYYNVYATITNFTNDKKAIAANNIMTVDMSSKFMNVTPLKVNIQFYLLHPKGRFTLSGTLGAMNATLLNPITEPSGLTRIKNGSINGIEFKGDGYDHGVDVGMKLLYKDLKVSALEMDKNGSKDLEVKKVTSIMANAFIKNDNPKRNDLARLAQVHVDRNTNRSFFNAIWQALLRAVLVTVGLKKE